MRRKSCFEIVDVSNEYMAVPVGEKTDNFNGIVVLSEPAAFLLKQMDEHKTEEELVDILLHEYEVAPSVAASNIRNIIKTFLDIGLIEE